MDQAEIKKKNWNIFGTQDMGNLDLDQFIKARSTEENPLFWEAEN